MASFSVIVGSLINDAKLHINLIFVPIKRRQHDMKKKKSPTLKALLYAIIAACVLVLALLSCTPAQRNGSNPPQTSISKA
jgi:hypothetical protein